MNAETPILGHSEALNLTTYRVANEPVRTYPFPHFYATDVFHPDIFRQIHACWPRPDQFLTYKDVGNIERERFYFRLEFASIVKLELEKRVFWEAMVEWLSSPAFLEVAFAKYAGAIQARLKEQLGMADVTPTEFRKLIRFNASLGWDISGYRLLPHADDPRVVYNLLFYVPESADRAALGTTVYVPKVRSFASSGEPRHSRDQFEAVTTFPYLPNTVFGFLRSPRSFHGMEGISAPNTERKLLFYSVMLTDDVARQAKIIS